MNLIGPSILDRAALLFGQRIAIHSSKKVDAFDIEDAMELGYANALPLKCIDIIQGALPGGVILGSVKLVNCVKESISPWFMGQYGFVLAEPIPLTEPLRCRGALGFWQIPKDMEATLVKSKSNSVREHSE